MKCKIDNCHHDSLPGTDRCKRHTDRKQRVRQYRLNNKDMEVRLDELTDVDHMASLEQEVALAQTMLEERLNAAGNDPAAIVAAHEATNRSLETICKLVQVMHKHNLATGEVLSKAALHKLMAEIIQSIATELEAFIDHPAYAGTIDRIEQSIQEQIEAADNEED